jgi:hypothetical protein
MWSKKELIDKQARFWVLMAGGGVRRDRVRWRWGSCSTR